MVPELLGIQPPELKFTFELKQPSSCSIQLLNNSDQYVAFKVKTTSPRKYSVRPNTGIIQPNSSSYFTVIMQAPREALPDFQCKDKFLIQSTVVPVGTTSEDITSSTFSKDSGKYIEENKLRVVLVGPPHSPVLLPMNGVLKQEPSNASPILGDQENLPVPHMLNQAARRRILLLQKNTEYCSNVTLPVEWQPWRLCFLWQVAKDVKFLQLAKDPENLKLPEDLEDLKLATEVKELKSKLSQLESKLSGAETTIRVLKEEKRTSMRERQTFQEELKGFGDSKCFLIIYLTWQAMLRRRSNGVRKAQVGFPFLFVCMVALVSMTLGYLLRP